MTRLKFEESSTIDMLKWLSLYREQWETGVDLLTATVQRLTKSQQDLAAQQITSMKLVADYYGKHKEVETLRRALDLAHGKILLLPTDSVPGLVFDPRSEKGKDRVQSIKGREAGKGYVSLVPSLEAALRFWKPLPSGWVELLQKNWPGPLTVVWEASDLCPPSIIRNGTVAIRVPKGNEDLMSLLKVLDVPLATTSVNKAGEPPATDWGDAIRWGAARDVDFPLYKMTPEQLKVASTLIQVLLPNPADCGIPRWEVLREGPVTL